MAQNRKAPAYQEYAASMLANRRFRLMTLPERGMFYTMRLECWENKQIPAAPNELAKYLGVDAGELEKALTDRVKSFFVEENGLFSCPELDDYRQHLDEIKLAQSNGGKHGAAITNGKRNTSKRRINTSDEGNTATNSQVSRRGGVESLVKPSTVKQSQTQPLERAVTTDPFIAAYESTERQTNDYAKVRG